MSSPKIYPEESFFVIPGKPGGPSPLPIWKQQELSSDPNFKDLREQVKELANKGKGVAAAAAPWSAKHGYMTSIKEEAAALKENTREANRRAAAAAEAAANKKSKQTPVKQKFVCIVM